jgi:hypothetical protein
VSKAGLGQTGGEGGRAVRTDVRADSTLREAKLSCADFGDLQLTFGLAAKTAFRVTQLDGPPRLIIDVQHAE